jgi:uncharacterized protein YbaR (Trm112 family)
MTTIKCPQPECDELITIDIAKSVDENGEVFVCPKCKQKFRYAEK